MVRLRAHSICNATDGVWILNGVCVWVCVWVCVCVCGCAFVCVCVCVLRALEAEAAVPDMVGQRVTSRGRSKPTIRGERAQLWSVAWLTHTPHAHTHTRAHTCS